MYKISIPMTVYNRQAPKEDILREVSRVKTHRVVLALARELGHAFSSRENLDLLKEQIEFFEAKGYKTNVWLGETFGHDGGEVSDDEVTPYQNIHFYKRGRIRAFCPLDESFINDFCTWVKNVAKCGASMIMLDDDFRMDYRAPGDTGCLCDMHMKKICEILGEEISRDDLMTKMLTGGRNKYRDAFLKAQGDAMYNFGRSLRAALDEVNPNARLGFCASPSIWDSNGVDAIELSKIMAGNTKPFMRVTGGPYWVPSVFPLLGYSTIGDVCEYTKMEAYWKNGTDMEMFAEGDTYPRPRTVVPAAYLECFDTILRADGTIDGNLKYMIDYVADIDYETGYVDASVDNSKLYDEIEKYFGDKKCVGVKPYVVPHLIKDAVFDGPTEENINKFQMMSMFQPALRFAQRNSLPTTYEDGFVNILFGDNARYIKEDELKNGNIIDLNAALILKDRGIDVGIESFGSFGKDNDGFAKILPQEHFLSEDRTLNLFGEYKVAKLDLKENAEISSTAVYDGQEYPFSYKYENKDGMRFLVYAFELTDFMETMGWFQSYSRRRQVTDAIAWLSGKPLDIHIDGNYPGLYTVEKKNEDAVAVGLWNLNADKIKDLKLKVNVPYKEIEFINCKGHTDGDKIIIDGILYPYEFAGVEVKI